jgi:hypothetical protein
MTRRFQGPARAAGRLAAARGGTIPLPLARLYVSSVAITEPMIERPSRTSPAINIGDASFGVDPMLNFRSSPELTAQIEDWIAAQPEPQPTRSEAIRRLLEKALAR